jgi:intracellular septation protein
MKAIEDSLAVFVLFIVYLIGKKTLADPSQAMYLATKVAMIFALIQAAYLWFKYKKIEAMQWFGILSVLVLGSMTLLFKDPHYIMLKPSVVYWVMAAGLMIGLFFGRSGMKAMMGQQLPFTISDGLWRTLTIWWAIFFTLMGFLNLYLAYTLDEASWFKFKIFGSLILTFAFIFLQGWYIRKKEPQAFTSIQS